MTVTLHQYYWCSCAGSHASLVLLGYIVYHCPVYVIAQWLRVAVGMAYIGVLFTVMVVCLIVLLPSRILRIKFTNRLCTLLGFGLIRISGCRVTVKGREHVDAGRPAIYAGNHTSILDAFTTIWLTPVGTVGVAKKEILYYPFYGVMWWLAGHLLVDRARTDRAKARMRKIGQFVRDNNLHICIMPEGHRSRTGRLLPFKKGFVHLALQTGLPIVPMVTVGAQHAWGAGGALLSVPIEITFLPPIDTSNWSIDTVDDHVAEIRAAILNALPLEQQPLDKQTNRPALRRSS